MKESIKIGQIYQEDIGKRNKLLKIAGWGTVEGYLSDYLASDSEDDRKIKTAERQALQKQNIRRTNQRSSATTTKLPPSKPANNQCRNVQQGNTSREQNTSSATASTIQNDSRRISTRPPSRTGGTCFVVKEMATGDNPAHSQEIIPDNEAETYEDKYFHSSHISSLDEPPGNCIKD